MRWRRRKDDTWISHYGREQEEIKMHWLLALRSHKVAVKSEVVNSFSPKLYRFYARSFVGQEDAPTTSGERDFYARFESPESYSKIFLSLRSDIKDDASRRSGFSWAAGSTNFIASERNVYLICQNIFAFRYGQRNKSKAFSKLIFFGRLRVGVRVGVTSRLAREQNVGVRHLENCASQGIVLCSWRIVAFACELCFRSQPKRHQRLQGWD